MKYPWMQTYHFSPEDAPTKTEFYPAVDAMSALQFRSFSKSKIIGKPHRPKGKLSVRTMKRLMLIGASLTILIAGLLGTVIHHLQKKEAEHRLIQEAHQREIHLLTVRMASMRNVLAMSEQQAALTVFEIQKVMDTVQEQHRPFLLEIIPQALVIQTEYSIPASATLAMAIYESSYGKSDLANHHNYFGMKALSKKWEGDVVRLPTRDRGVLHVQPFRAFASLNDGVRGYAHFLSQSERYEPAFQSDSGIEFVDHLLKGGYCPDRDYLKRIEAIIDRHQLDRLDAVSLYRPVTQ
ncbi:MAG: glucosaminidase domain-containing protein [Verrucomicrobiota bacterium]